MPQDNLMYSGPMFRIITWERKFAIFPHRCISSNRIIWLKYAREGYFIKGLGEGDAEWLWLTEEEYLLLCLKAVNE